MIGTDIRVQCWPSTPPPPHPHLVASIVLFSVSAVMSDMKSEFSFRLNTGLEVRVSHSYNYIYTEQGCRQLESETKRCLYH